MTYSLNTLNADRQNPPPSGAARFAQEIALVLGAAGLLFWLIALLSHSLADPAWSTTGSRDDVRNWAGRLGALLSDGSFYLLGFSVWWCVAAAARAWLAGLARWLRVGRDEPTPTTQVDAAWWQRPHVQRVAFWLALLILLCASSVLEWGRLYRLEPHLPGHAGGVLGASLGPLAARWLGSTGSTVLALALMVLASGWAFRFSWGHWAERIGERLDLWFDARREKREASEDLRIGEKAARAREEVVEEARVEIKEHHAPPVRIIEPVLVDVPKSERVIKERQKPLFVEMPDSKLPQVDLLDAVPGQQSTVAPETLEMTSRLDRKSTRLNSSHH